MQLQSKLIFLKKMLPTLLMQYLMQHWFIEKTEKVQLIGFGNFEVRERSARKGRNPQTGEQIDIPASKVPAFKDGKALKDAVK